MRSRPGLLPATGLVPTVAQLLHVPTILLGTLCGGAMLTAMAYLGFSSVVKINTENLTAMLAFAPVTAWLFQVIGVAAGLIVAESLDPRLIGAMAVLVAAVLLIFWAGHRARTGAALATLAAHIQRIRARLRTLSLRGATSLPQCRKLGSAPSIGSESVRARHVDRAVA